MENNIENKKNNGLIVLIVVLIIGLIGLSSFVVYDKFIKNPVNDNSEKDNNKTNNNDFDKGNNIVEKNADDRYKEYLSTLEKNIRTSYGNFTTTEENGQIKNEVFVNKRTEGMLFSSGHYRIEVNEKLELLLTTKGEYKISDNVLYFTTILTGNAGCKSIYFIKNDGNVYTSGAICPDGMYNDIEIRKIDKKNIILILDGWGSGSYYNENNEFAGPAGRGCVPIFIDIEGNMFIGE